MKTIRFRPLRRIKKTGKITVASYMQWRKVKVADYDKFTLIIDNEYKRLLLDEYVCDHKGETLFWRDFNPDEIPTLKPYILRDDDGEEDFPPKWKSDLGGTGYYWGVPGLDCDGVPLFSHYSAEEVAKFHFSSINDFEPLTVRIVIKWFGWFLYQLNNSTLSSSSSSKQL